MQTPGSACDNEDHVVLLQKLDKLILTAEENEYDKGFRTRLHALRNLLVIHANKTRGVTQVLKENIIQYRTRILFVGFSIAFVISIPYLILSRTSWLSPGALYCSTFRTTDKLYENNEVRACVNGISHEYNPQNGDVELDLFFTRSNGDRVQVDATFWIADELGGKALDYTGEYNINRVRHYSPMGFLISDDKKEISSWEQPLVPEDVREPLWKFVKAREPLLTSKREPVEETVANFFNNGFATLVATVGTIGATLYKFVRAGN